MDTRSAQRRQRKHPAIQGPEISTRPLTLVLFVGTAIFLAALGGVARAQDADDVYWDWPVGFCVESKFAPGYGYTIQQDYANRYDGISDRCSESDTACYHAGLDIYRNGGADTNGDTVFAAADGRVIEVIDWGNAGAGILVEHDSPDGTFYAHYIHLQENAASIFVQEGQPVRRGQPLGRVAYYPYGPHHLHFETRPGLRVSFCPLDVNNCSEDQLHPSCRGNGYSIIYPSSEDHHLEEWGFTDTVDVLFAYRPPFPAQIATDIALNVRADTNTSSELVGTLAADAWVTGTAEPVLLPAGGDTVEEAWYPLTLDNGVSGYSRSYADIVGSFTSDLLISEEVRVGREWQPPGEPQIDLRFDCATNDYCADGATMTNWAVAELPGMLNGALFHAPPYDAFDDTFCDQVGRFEGGSSIELTPAAEINFRGGIAVEASVWLDRLTIDGEQIIAAQGEAGAEEWKLAVVRDAGISELVFTVQPASGDPLSVAWPLPEPACLDEAIVLCDGTWDEPLAGRDPIDCSTAPANCDPDVAPTGCFSDFGYRQWRHVAALADPLAEHRIRLYWDGAQVREAALTQNLRGSDEVIRVGEGLNGRLDNLVVRTVEAEPEVFVDTVLIIDSSGSMSTYDPRDQRKNAASVYLDVSPPGDQVGVVDFDSDVEWIALKPLSDADEKQAIRQFIAGIDSSGLTEITLGVDKACDLLAAARDETRKAGILLTDGISDWDPAAKDCFLADGWELHALGFGGADGGLLTTIVEGTGGEAHILATPEEALCELQQVRARVIDSEEFPCQTFVIYLFQEIIITLVVLPEHGYVNAFTAWPGSDVEMSLTSPSGRIIDRETSAPDVVHQVGSTFEMYGIADPEPGEWQVRLYGADVPATGEQVVFGANMLSSTPGPGTLPPDTSGAMPNVDVLWPPNHKTVDVWILGVTDPEGEPVTVTITGVTQDEPVGGPGKYAPDAYGVGTDTVALRAEREGPGNGRVYEITFVARDGSGGEAAGSVQVCVPHSHRGEPCVDDGQDYDSTVP